MVERLPIIVTAGAALLGFLAGEMLLTDPAVVARFGELPDIAVDIGGTIGAVIVVVVGTLLQRRRLQEAAAAE